MATAAAPNVDIAADPDILRAIVSAVESCLTMCDTTARCVGYSTVPVRDPGNVTGLIGVHGDVSGFVTVNMAEQVARAAVAGLLQEHFDRLTPQVVDGVGEMTNIISGGIKSGLAKTPWAFSHVTVPSVIVGSNYQIAYASGLQFLSVVFEHKNEEALMLDDRMIQVAVSLIRL
ncbi:MAG: chemotaxis protein CheX [Pirellulales bacterium]|nr:chemotaxis protein CheX [Pirellulales bacterium]